MSEKLDRFPGKFKAIFIFGPPGAGKGTIGRMICAASGAHHLSSGEIFRRMHRDLPAGKLVAKYADHGLLVPDDVTMEIWRDYVWGLITTNCYCPFHQHLFLDGIPRTVQQAELMDPLVEVRQVIVLRVDDPEVLIQRLIRRARVEGRADDADHDILRKRMEVYESQTAALLDHFPKERTVIVNADQRPLEVFRDCLVQSAEVLAELYCPPGRSH